MPVPCELYKSIVGLSGVCTRVLRFFGLQLLEKFVKVPIRER